MLVTWAHNAVGAIHIAHQTRLLRRSRRQPSERIADLVCQIADPNTHAAVRKTLFPRCCQELQTSFVHNDQYQYEPVTPTSMGGIVYLHFTSIEAVPITVLFRGQHNIIRKKVITLFIEVNLLICNSMTRKVQANVED